MQLWTIIFLHCANLYAMLHDMMHDILNEFGGYKFGGGNKFSGGGGLLHVLFHLSFSFARLQGGGGYTRNFSHEKVAHNVYFA